METVILRSDIARIVLRYLQDQHLKDVSRKFCKTSPHLKEQFNAYKHGLQTHCFFPPLEVIISEYVKVLGIANQLISTLPENTQNRLRDRFLSEKISELLRLTHETISPSPSSSVDSSESSQYNLQNLIQQSKENKRKRKSSVISSESANETEHTQKKRRLSQKYYFLNTEHKKRPDNLFETTANETSGSDEQNQTNHLASEMDISNDLPKSESTPRIKTHKPNIVAKALPEITNAILDNSEFQKRLVDNINEALNLANKTSAKTNQQPSEITHTTKENQITCSQLFDEMVKNILEATERDPTFDAIIQEVVNLPNTTEGENNKSKLEEPANVTETSLSQLRNGPADTVPQTSNVQTALPRTPLIIRHAVVAATPATTIGNIDENTTSHPVSQLNSNNLLNIFTDSSLSISRLISINPHDITFKPGQADQSSISIGNSTADHILSQLTNNGAEASTLNSNDPTLPDVGPNQMFPVFISSDGVVTPITCYLNANELSLATNVNCNQILTAPIVITSTADPTPVKVNAIPIVENLDSKIEISNVNECEKKKTMAGVAILSEEDKTLTENQNVESKTTPATSGITTRRISKSLSTPRRRTTPSHIRALTFSPASSAAPIASSGATPLSTRRNISNSKIFNIPANGNEVVQLKSLTAAEKPIIRNVEILPQLSLPATTTITAAALGNDSSNSCSVPPLFAGEESSNQTVIKTELSLFEKSGTSSIQKDDDTSTHNTPKRKQLRRTAVIRCKRQLSKSSNEEEHEVEATTTTGKGVVESQKETQTPTETIEKPDPIEISITSKVNESKKEITLEDWKKLRSCTYNDLDARLREINANRIVVDKPPVKREMKKKTRPKKRNNRKSQNQAVKNPTEGDQSELDVSSSLSGTNKSANEQQEVQVSNVTSKNDEQINVITETTTKYTAELTSSTKKSQPPVAVTAEVERRMANIGYLLETPFKDSTCGGISFVPPTPGVFVPSLDTPLAKARGDDELRESASFLFGSLTKSELGTPQLNAITPAFRFTPLVAKDATTPRSVAPTEYSSGGSYYRPDESEDLDRNFDKMLRDSAQKKRVEESQDECGISPAHQEEKVISETKVQIVEIPVEKLKVAPLVLRRVKSFGQDNTEVVEGEQAADAFTADPHYTLASGLPKVYLEKEEASSSSSSSNNSSSSSSSSSSNSSESNSSSDSEIEEGELRKTEESIRPPLISSLENLSDISSAEDEDWQKIEENKAKTAPDEEADLQLIDNHGEIRFPFRSWLTPRKLDEASNQLPMSNAVIKMTLKSAEKLNRNAELESKRQRMKEKLQQDTTLNLKNKVQRKQATISTINKKQQQQTPIAKQQSPEAAVKTQSEKETNNDVLTALQLSAKKSTNVSELSPSKMPPPGEMDDNAVSHIFASKDGNAPLPPTKACVSIPALAGGIKTFFPTMANPGGQRKCLQIEALPAIKSSSRAKSKQIVRTPLGFKGTSTGVGNNSTSVTSQQKTTLIKFSPKTKNKTANNIGGGKAVGEKLRISPRLQAAEKRTKKKESNKAPTPPLKTTKRRAPAKKQPPKENVEKNIDSTIKESEIESKISIPNSKQTVEEAPSKKTAINPTARKKEKTVAVKNPTQSNAAKKKIDENDRNLKKSTSNIPQPEAAEMKQNPIKSQDKTSNDYSDAVGEDNNDDEDPSADCIRVTLDESDTKSHVSYIHDEKNPLISKIPTSPRSIGEKLKNFKLHIAFESQKKHTWTISKEFCLFTQPPVQFTDQSPEPQETVVSNAPSQSIRNIPKKRRICIITNNDEVDSASQTLKANQTELSRGSSQTQQIEENTKSSLDTTNVNAATEINAKQPVSTLNSTTKAPADKIEIDDIESILSQLHDTEKS